MTDDTTGTDGVEKTDGGNTGTATSNTTQTGVTTVLDDSGASDGGVKAQQTQGEEKGWRQKIAGKDEKFLKVLDRFGTEEDFGKSYRELEKKVGTGPKPLPENPTPEQLTAWRKDNGLPETPDAYELKLPDGLKFDEADKPGLDAFLKTAHENNMKPETVNTVLGWYKQMEADQETHRIETERQNRADALETLQRELGPEFRATQGMIQAWLGRQGDIGKILATARAPDGKALFNNSDFILWLNNHIRQTEPSATVVHNAEMSGVSIDDEIAQIQKVINEDPQKYNNDKKMQDRLLQLRTAKKKMAA